MSTHENRPVLLEVNDLKVHFEIRDKNSGFGNQIKALKQ